MTEESIKVQTQNDGKQEPLAVTPNNLEDLSPNSNLPKDLYTFYEKLGEGAFCKVYKALYLPTNEIIAVKV
jgi:serine/threonine protein kinase